LEVAKQKLEAANKSLSFKVHWFKEKSKVIHEDIEMARQSKWARKSRRVRWSRRRQWKFPGAMRCSNSAKANAARDAALYSFSN
jgi:hypothetical protein